MGMAYIVVATEYLTKCAEAKAVKIDNTAHAATILYENIILHLDVLRSYLMTEKLTS